MLLSKNRLLGNHVAKLERNSLFSYGYDARNEHSAGATRNDSAEITSCRHSFLKNNGDESTLFRAEKYRVAIAYCLGSG